MHEPWLLFSKRLDRTIPDKVTKWWTGGLRRPARGGRFGDVIRSGRAEKAERARAAANAEAARVPPPGRSRDPPPGEGVVLDPCAGVGLDTRREAQNARSLTSAEAGRLERAHTVERVAGRHHAEPGRRTTDSQDRGRRPSMKSAMAVTASSRKIAVFASGRI